MKIPTKQQAEEFLEEGARLNPGPWIAHSKNVALAAKSIAEAAGLDPQIAYILGLLHDIGRRYGMSYMKHSTDGYHFMMEHGFEDVARICLSHSFACKDINTYVGKWDVHETSGNCSCHGFKPISNGYDDIR